MKLIEALEVLQRPVKDNASQVKIFLAVGFMPLHLQTFLGAELRALFPEERIDIEVGVFGDLCGSVERLKPFEMDSIAVVVEWSDLDARLGVRSLGGWRPEHLTDIVESAARTKDRLERGLKALSERAPVVVCMPTLPLPPMFWTRPAQAGSAMLQLQLVVASLAESLSQSNGLRIVNSQLLNETSAPSERYDLKSDVMTGFPYCLRHASAVGKSLADLVRNPSPKKGLITDLDDTLWAGIVGEDGVDGISWDLNSHTHMHGLFQQVLASLAGAGILVAVASKNDPAIVDRAFERTDLLLTRASIFPLEIHWSRKSESVQRILKTWNVSADSVVFVDDNPMEIAEVKGAFPEMECILFPKNNYQGIWDLFKHLRVLFGKPCLTDEDTIRLHSVRESGAWRDIDLSSGSSSDDFLRASDASVVFDSTQSWGDLRAFELINKTNQFNLNGKRFTETAWRAFFSEPAAFLLTVSYKDKFGPLGKIAAIVGKAHGRTLCVNSWVMSCRAFSRRIEHQCLKYLFENFEVQEIAFDYEPTLRNGPLQTFFEELNGNTPTEGFTLSKGKFEANVPLLFHRVEGIVRV